MAKTPVAAKDPKQGDLIEKIEITAASDQIDPEVLTEEPLEVEEEPEVEAEDASAALQKQIEALKKSESIQKDRAERFRQEAEKNQQLAKDRGTEVDKVRKDALQSQLDAVSTALDAAQSEAESAERDIRTAINSGDVDAQVSAQRRLAKAEANISKLEDGKFEIETRIKNPPEAEKPIQQDQQNVMPQRIQNWVKRNQSKIDAKMWDKIRSHHWDIVDDEGVPFDSDEYIESMETRIGWRKTDDEPINLQQRQAETQLARTQHQRTSIVSAPVSREAPSTPNQDRNTGQVKLTPLQREAAKISGVSEKVYAENELKIRKMKANGSYELKGG